MSDLITALTSLFSFLTTQLTNIANFFTTNVIGQIILGVALFSVAVNIVIMIVNKVHK